MIQLILYAGFFPQGLTIHIIQSHRLQKPPACNHLFIRGEVKDIRLKAKTKAMDTKKIRGQGQGPRTAFPKCSPKKKSSQKFFRRSQKKKKKEKGLHKKFSGDLHKKMFSKIFSGAPQNFNNSKNTAVLEPRTGQFSRICGLEAKAKDFKMCPRELHLCFLYHYLRKHSCFSINTQMY